MASVGEKGKDGGEWQVRGRGAGKGGGIQETEEDVTRSLPARNIQHKYDKHHYTIHVYKTHIRKMYEKRRIQFFCLSHERRGGNIHREGTHAHTHTHTYTHTYTHTHTHTHTHTARTHTHGVPLHYLSLADRKREHLYCRRVHRAEGMWEGERRALLSTLPLPLLGSTRCKIA